MKYRAVNNYKVKIDEKWFEKLPEKETNYIDERQQLLLHNEKKTVIDFNFLVIALQNNSHMKTILYLIDDNSFSCEWQNNWLTDDGPISHW